MSRIFNIIVAFLRSAGHELWCGGDLKIDNGVLHCPKCHRIIANIFKGYAATPAGLEGKDEV